MYTERDGKKNEREICGLWSEGHVMNRTRGPTEVCPGGGVRPGQGEEERAAGAGGGGRRGLRSQPRGGRGAG